MLALVLIWHQNDKMRTVVLLTVYLTPFTPSPCAVVLLLLSFRDLKESVKPRAKKWIFQSPPGIGLMEIRERMSIIKENTPPSNMCWWNAVIDITLTLLGGGGEAPGSSISRCRWIFSSSLRHCYISLKPNVEGMLFLLSSWRYMRRPGNRPENWTFTCSWKKE